MALGVPILKHIRVLADLVVKRQQNKWKADTVLFELADVMNAL